MKRGASNDRNGFYERLFIVKVMGDGRVKVPLNWLGESHAQAILRYQKYETELGKDLCLTFLGGVSTRMLEMMSYGLMDRKIFHT